EGEQRSGRAWPGVVRVPWRAWYYRLARELRLDDSPASNKALLRTATEPERIERDVAALAQRQCYSATAAVQTSSRMNYECLAALLAQLGVHATWQTGAATPTGRVDLEIYDGWPGSRESLAENGAIQWTTDARQRLSTPSIL